MTFNREKWRAELLRALEIDTGHDPEGNILLALLERAYAEGRGESWEQKHEFEQGDESGLECIARWVREYKAKLDQRGGGIFDSALQCVSEGGEVFYVDPEEIERAVAALAGRTGDDVKPVGLDELEKLEAKATPGPWEADRDREYVYTRTPPAHLPVFEKTDTTYCVMRWPSDWDGLPEGADLRLILALRNDAPAMIEELRELRTSRVPPEREELLLAAMDAATARAERDALRAEVEGLKAQLATAHDDAIEEAALVVRRFTVHDGVAFSHPPIFNHVEREIRALKKTKGGGA